MQRTAMLNTIKRQIAFQKTRHLVQPSCDVFINHRGIDTKRSIASLLYHQLLLSRIPTFLDNKNMKPGDKLFAHIDNAILGSKIGVAVFSPRYCESYFCLHELALMMESRKKVIPIFCDVKPSALRVSHNIICTQSEIRRFSYAIEEAKNTVGLAFDTTKGNWSDVVTYATDLVKESLIEIDNKKNKKNAAQQTQILYS
ncbi:probable 2' cyclic ADP-D-ribose synthase BdTIR [Rutidosis leptorrhynchoides]|uniref:probable 2' cyclic ADP-D-ribose synthase BdTIR n=1 Tax=Rutidosis leptorrhynchoides TaxID=125765 RepID=UPI003A993AC3